MARQPMNITVILCTFNRCRLLPKTLENIAVSRLPEAVDWGGGAVNGAWVRRTDEIRHRCQCCGSKSPIPH